MLRVAAFLSVLEHQSNDENNNKLYKLTGEREMVLLLGGAVHYGTTTPTHCTACGKNGSRTQRHEKKMGGGACRRRRELEEVGLCVNCYCLFNEII
jgi:hypothetical protein